MKYDALLVLGRGISKEGNLPEMSIKSVEKAKELLDNGQVARIIFCGKWSRHFDFTPPTTEAAAMKELALKLGAQEDKLFIEDQSLDTISNLYYAKKRYLAPQNWRAILLLTLHENDERALLMARYMFGPEYEIEGVSIGYEFPSDKAEYILQTERDKVRIFKEFVESNHIEQGDDDRLFQEHLRYIEGHDIPPTFQGND